MPKCFVCDRHFSNRDALQAHIRSSSIEHPTCVPCNRRFLSEKAKDEHMAARHPPTFPCVICDRVFHAQFALEDHFRGSKEHPNCIHCGRGFENYKKHDEHLAREHATREEIPTNTLIRRVQSPQTNNVPVTAGPSQNHRLAGDFNPYGVIGRGLLPPPSRTVADYWDSRPVSFQPGPSSSCT